MRGPVADAHSNKATALAPVWFFNPIWMRIAEKWADARGDVPLAFIHKTREEIDDVLACHLPGRQHQFRQCRNSTRG